MVYDAEFRRKYGTHAIGSGTGAEPVEHEYHAEGFYLEDRNKALRDRSDVYLGAGRDLLRQ